MTVEPRNRVGVRRSAGVVKRTALALLLAPALALAGCFTTDAAITISGSDRVNGVVHVAVPADATTSGIPWEVPPGFEDGVTVETGHSGDDLTATYTLRDLTFDEVHDLVDGAADGAFDLELERTGGNQVSVSGKAALKRYQRSRVTLAISFPAPVTGTNGTVDGDRTVRWTMDGGRDTTFWATAPAGSTDRDQLLLWMALATATGLLAALLVFLWARRDRDMLD